MQNAIITGLVGNNSIPSQVLGTCPSANCTWNMYTSLAFCSTVQNVTSTMVEHCSKRQQGVTSSGEISFAVPFNRTCNVSTSALEDKGNITSPTANLESLIISTLKRGLIPTASSIPKSAFILPLTSSKWTCSIYSRNLETMMAKPSKCSLCP